MIISITDKAGETTKLCPTCKKYRALSDFESAGNTGQEANKTYKWCSACRWVKFGSPEAKARKAANLAKAKARKAAAV